MGSRTPRHQVMCRGVLGPRHFCETSRNNPSLVVRLRRRASTGTIKTQMVSHLPVGAIRVDVSLTIGFMLHQGNACRRARAVARTQLLSATTNSMS